MNMIHHVKLTALVVDNLASLEFFACLDDFDPEHGHRQ
jgi:hypothetical protein